MDSKKWLLLGFLGMVLLQLYVPFSMILGREDALSNGEAYKFRTAPIDPRNPFMGSYIRLNFENDHLQVPEGHDWHRGQTVFVHLRQDTKGFAQIGGVSKVPPAEGTPYLKAKVRQIIADDAPKLYVDYPFDRYYMEESKAYDAELAHRRLQQAPDSITYALVKVKDGQAVLEDVMVNGTPIAELIRLERGRGQ